MPRITTGITGAPACAAATKAPMRNGSSPGSRRSVPSANTSGATPLLTLSSMAR